jgi:glycosyltransferase involved in cell wall biosynthesis
LRLAQRWGLHLAHKPSLTVWRVPFWRFHRAIRFVLESVSVLLPNSRAEQQQIEQQFGVCRPTVIVPNAADTKLFLPVENRPDRPRNGVLCVGRLEPRKNQLTLITALRETDIPLTLVGQAGRYNAAYYRRCRQAAGANIEIVEQQPPEVLSRLYRQAQVHACVSWYETPGLASLEASLCGCAIVVTPGGCTQEYFGEEAYYCRPDDPDSIRHAIETALEHGTPSQLTQRVAREFTWEMAAEKTLEGYRLAQESRS